MNKWVNRILHVSIAVIAYGYLTYKLVTFDDYSTITAHFSSIDATQFLYLIACFLLFPINILAESVKWRYLLRDLVPLTLREAMRQVYCGAAGAFITPARVGDYPTRVTLIADRKVWIPAITLGFVGTAALSSLQIILGLPAALNSYSIKWYMYLVSAMFVFGYAFSPAICRRLRNRHFSDNVRNIVDTLATLDTPRLLYIMLLSALRYAVYCVQMILILRFCGVDLSIGTMLTDILAYYMLVSVTPSMPVADVGIRGSWAIVVFSQHTANIPAIAMASILLWVINAMMPMIVGTMIRKTNR